MEATVGLLAFYLAGGYEGPVVSAVARATSDAGRRLLAIKTAGLVRANGPGCGVSLNDLGRVGWDRVGGFIAMPNGVDRGYIEALRAAGKPVVTIAQGDLGPLCQNVVTDNASGVKQAVEHLLGHGHSRIAFVGWLEQFDIRERYAAYCSTLLEHGVHPDPHLLYEAEGNYEDDAVGAAQRMLADGLPSTAVLAATDLNATAVMRVLTEGGCALPHDQAVVGFDDIPGSALLSPSLSSVSQHPDRMGALATELLLRQMAGETVATGSYVVPTSFVARRSCGCSRGESTDLRNNHYYELRKFVRDEYRISADLLKEQDPCSLQWLRGTDAQKGVLALWRDGPDDNAPALEGTGRHGQVLDVVGTFNVSGGTVELASTSFPVAQFPPEELVEPGSGGGHLTVVCPLQSEDKDWGFLAVAQRLGSGLGQEAYFMWSELLTRVLDHKAMAEEVRESEERYALASRATNDGLWDWDLSKGSVYFSYRWKQMLGYAQGEVGSGPEEWLERVHPDDQAKLRADLRDLQSGECSSILNEHRVQARDGNYLWVQCRGLAVPGLGRPATRLVGSLSDITERRSLEDRLRQQALHDSLTGLANRALFLERLSQAVERAHEIPGYSYTVIWLDLDNFKSLNDDVGHLYGDELLVQVAQRIRAHIRRNDTAARFGGDEFVILVEGTDDAASLATIVRRLSDHLNQPYDLNGYTAVVTASLGIATGTDMYEGPEEILRDADIAMYEAKAKRCGACVTFDHSMGRTSSTAAAGTAMLGSLAP